MGRKARLTMLQKVADVTNGVMTAGNMVTFLGFLVVLAGLQQILLHHYLAGAAALVIGRIADIADGWLADKTHTKSPLGELLDASTDKIVTLLTIVVLYVSHTAAWWVLAVLVLPHLIILAVTYRTVRRGGRLHPSHAGKLSMAFAWISLTGLVLIKAWNHPPLQFVVAIAVTTSIVLGLYAGLHYGMVRRK